MALTPFDLAPDQNYGPAMQQVSNLQMRPAYQQSMDQVGQLGGGFRSALGGVQGALLGRAQQPFLQQGALAGQQIGQQVAGQTLQGTRQNESFRVAFENAERKRQQDMQDTMLSHSMSLEDRARMRELAGRREQDALIGAAINTGMVVGGGFYERYRNPSPPPMPSSTPADGIIGAPPSF